MLVTHYQRLLNYIVPDYVHVMDGGRIIKTGGKELALELESRGYDWVDEPRPRAADAGDCVTTRMDVSAAIRLSRHRCSPAAASRATSPHGMARRAARARRSSARTRCPCRRRATRNGASPT